MPFESQAQRGLMYATAQGAHTGVPIKVAREFVASDKPGKLPEHVHPKRDNGGGIAGDYLEPPAAQTHRSTGNSGGGVPGTHDNNLLQPGPEGAVVGSRPIPGTHDQNSFSNKNDVAPYNPPGVEDDRHHGLAFGGLAHGDPLGGLATPHPVKIGAPPAPTAMTGHVNMHPQNFMRFNAKELGAFASGGAVYPDMPFNSGLIPGSGAGRTDRLPLSVPNDSHVIPSDVVSSLGQGTTAHGGRILEAALGGGIGPYGTALPPETKGHGPPHAPAVSQRMMGEAHGGSASAGNGRVSILAASGEFVVDAGRVRALGERAIESGHAKRGEPAMEAGHRLLDEMIHKVRDHQMKWLRRAPPPKK